MFSPSGWYFFYLVTTGWIFGISLLFYVRIQSIILLKKNPNCGCCEGFDVLRLSIPVALVAQRYLVTLWHVGT